MIQMMMATIGSPAANNLARGAGSAQRRQSLMLRKMAGLAIVASGFAVLVAQALQHTLGG